MVDFGKLKDRKQRNKPTDPVEIFRRLAKPEGINDLYSSQSEVLNTWFENRKERDIILKLHTGGGKTLVGLLAAQSILNETKEPVLYLSPTVQLVNQTLEKARAIGIPAVAYERGMPLNSEFVNGAAIMVATYKALFNGKSKFGLRGTSAPQKVAGIVLDDAHAAFSVVREAFTLELASDFEVYKKLSTLFRESFRLIDKLGTYDDVVSGKDFSVLEIPHWAWNEKKDAVREFLKPEIDTYPLVWPLLRDKLHLCHAFVSRKGFTITPIQPFVDSFPTFFDAPKRIYMSATIADDSDLIRTFDVSLDAITKTLTSKSLAGISERMILIPDLMPFEFDVKGSLLKILKWTSKKKLGSIILVPSDKDASEWSTGATVTKGTEDAQKKISALQEQKEEYGPIVFANRYDGIDLPGNSCRLLVMSGLPIGTSNYDLFRASALFGGNTITKMIAQRIEQGIGRASRGAGDYCVVILTGSDLAGWISKTVNFKFLTSATKAQLEMGTEISKEVSDLKNLTDIINQSFKRDKEWIEYHADMLADLVDEKTSDQLSLLQSETERKAIRLWQDGYHDKAITKITKFIRQNNQLDDQTKGWMMQLAAKIADHWDNPTSAEEFQCEAFAYNRNLTRPLQKPPYRPLQVPGSQAVSMANQIAYYKTRKGLLAIFEETSSQLNSNSSANQFENALCELAKMLGLMAERYDIKGEGPDILWLLPDKTGFVIEAKSRKKKSKSLTKEEHGQLLVADEWFREHYPDYTSIRISVHPNNHATKASIAGTSYALTYENLGMLISESRRVLKDLCDSQLKDQDLVNECERKISSSKIRYDLLAELYLIPFTEALPKN